MALLVAVATVICTGGILRAAPAPRGALEAGQRPVSGGDDVTLPAEVSLQTLRVSPVDASGTLIQGLTAADFLVKEDGERREIVFFDTVVDAPLDVALVLDQSGSADRPTWSRFFPDLLPAFSPQRDCVLLLVFGETVRTSIWGRPDDPALASAIEQSRPSGVTSLYDALVEGTQGLVSKAGEAGGGLAGATSQREAAGGSDAGCPRPASGTATDAPPRRRMAVVAVTDGFDTSDQSIDRVQMLTDAAGVPIFQIEFARGGPLERARTGSMSNQVADLRALVRSSGGEIVSSNSSEAYRRLLGRLRGFYVVGYRISATQGEPPVFEYTRHEIEVELPDRRARVLYRPRVYRSAFDAPRARFELDEGIRQLQIQQLDAALSAFARSIDAHPYLAAPYAYRARILLSTEGAESALASALRAAELEPANGEHHLLVSHVAGTAGRYELAWEHAIRGAQAGSATTEVFEALAASSDPPADLRERLEAPRVVVLAAPPSQPDLIVRAALPKAVRSIQRALSQSAQVALVAGLDASQYLVWVADKELSDKLPRRFEGRLMLVDRAGDRLNEDDFTLEDLDNPAENAAGLADHIEKILEKMPSKRR